MRKISEIRHELSIAVNEAKALTADATPEQKAAAANKMNALTDELHTALDIDKAEKEAAAAHMGEKEKEELNQFSLRRFILGASRRHLDGFEAEMHEEAKKEAAKCGMPLKGFGIPYAILANTRAADGQNAGNDKEGGHLITTTASTYIEALRDAVVINQLGAEFVTGLNGKLSFPKGGSIDFSWEGEADVTAVSKEQFAKIEMAPHRLSAVTAVTMDLLNQSSYDVERMLMRDMILGHAAALDKAVIAGSGAANQPTGILNLAGIGAVAGGQNGAAIDWAKVVDLESKVAAANANFGKLAYLTNAKVMGKLKSTEKAAGTARYLVENGMLNGYKCTITNMVPSNLTKGSATSKCSALIFGNFSDIVVGQWGGLDIIADPYTLADSAQVRLVINAYHDVLVRHPESFAAMKDVLTD